jgi:hypothetical protein
MIHVPHAVKPVFIMLGIVRRHRTVVRYALDFQIDMPYLHDPGLPFGEHLTAAVNFGGLKVKNSRYRDKYKRMR